MPTYTPPLRDMQFVMHEVFKVTDEFKAMPQHAEVDVDTINAVIEEAGKFTSQVLFPLNQVGDREGCTLNKETHEVTTPTGFAALGVPPEIDAGLAQPGAHDAFAAHGHHRMPDRAAGGRGQPKQHRFRAAVQQARNHVHDPQGRWCRHGDGPLG